MQLFKKYRWIFLLILAALTFRIFLFLGVMDKGPYFDHLVFREWAKKSYSYGFNNAYRIHSPDKIRDIDQPPGTVYLMRGSYEVYLLTARALTRIYHLDPGSTIWINDNLMMFFFRFPSIIADLALGFLIFLTVKNKTRESIGLVASSIFLFGPQIFYNSAVWGQLESINNLFFYLSILFLIKKKAFYSVLFLALSLFVKLSVLPLLPIYLIFALSGLFFKRKNFIFSSIIVTLIIYLLCLPFSANPLWIFDVARFSLEGTNQEITVNAYNLWWFIFKPELGISPPQMSTVFYGLSLNIWAYLIFALFYIPIIIRSFRFTWIKKLISENIFLILGIAAFASFLFLPKMHERYLYPVFPMLITWAGIRGKFWTPVLILSVIHFLNLYIVWNPSLIFFRSTEEVILGETSKIALSLLTIIIFLCFYFKLLFLKIFISRKGK